VGKTRRFVALVSDMDGTLVDSEPLHAKAYQRVMFRQFGVRVRLAEFHQFTGATDAMIGIYLVDKYKLPITPTQLVMDKEAQLAQLLSGAEPLPGVVATLQRAQELRLKRAIASSATLECIKNVLALLKLRKRFSVIASGEEVANSKPAPDVFLLAAERLGVDPRLCIALEDSKNGSRAAAAAGMYCVGIRCKSAPKEDLSAAHIVLRSLEELNLDQLLAS
jgi:HAD superfamily hydrolase (TIGR01509 family)